MTAPLELTRTQILAYRRRVAGLDERSPPGEHSLQHAAWAGLQDSMPRAALLSIHARVGGTTPSSWEDPAFIQIWGPRFNAYVVAKRDIAVFTLGRLPDKGAQLERARDIAARLAAALAGGRSSLSDAARAMAETSPNRLRYAAPTGTVAIRWDGARQPEVWNLPAPTMEPLEARLELARRYLRVFGPATPAAFAAWAGVSPSLGLAAFTALGESLVPVRTPVGDAWMQRADEADLWLAAAAPAAARLLPSGDTWYLLQGADRALLVPDERFRRALWTSRVWPGALLVEGETLGTWRRAGHVVTIEPWSPLTPSQRAAVEVEAAALPLPGIDRPIDVRWDRE